MTEPVVLSAEPSTLRAYARALLQARRPVRARSKPALVVERQGLRLTEERVRPLQALLGGGGGVPLTFPHVWAGGLQLAVLTDRRFPVRILGAVHARSELTQLAPIPMGEALTLRVSLDDVRDTERGTEHDLLTELFGPGGVLLWRGVSTNLTLDPSTRRSGGRDAPPPPEGEERTTFDAPRGLGRRYGAVSGDRNPIHLSRYTARLFGFPRAIAHGMWTVGRSLVALGHPVGQPGDELLVRFRRPLLLPGRVSLRWSQEADTTRFWAVTEPAGELHVEGSLRTGPPPS